MADNIFQNIIQSVANGANTVNDGVKGLFGAEIAPPVIEKLPHRNRPYENQHQEEYFNDDESEFGHEPNEQIYERFNPKPKSFNGSITDEQLEVMARRNIKFMLLTNVEGITIAQKVMAHFTLSKEEKLMLYQFRKGEKQFPTGVIEDICLKEERKINFENSIVDLEELLDEDYLIQCEVEFLKKKRDAGKIKPERAMFQILKASGIFLTKITGGNFDLLPAITGNMINAFKGK